MSISLDVFSFGMEYFLLYCDRPITKMLHFIKNFHKIQSKFTSAMKYESRELNDILVTRKGVCVSFGLRILFLMEKSHISIT